MIRALLKITIRNFKKQLGFSLLNILGLTIGIAVSIIGFLYVLNEFSYDKFNKDADRIHRIAIDALFGTTEIHQTWTSAPYAQALYDYFPEIDKITRIATWNYKFEYQDKKFVENNVFVVDSTFFDIFTIPVIQGKTSNLLNEPYCAVLTKSTAQKYFGNDDPINKIISQDSTNYRVIAVVKDLPKNSHFHFKIAVSLISYDGYYNSSDWGNSGYRTYLMLHNNVDYKTIDAKFPGFVDKYLYKGRRSEAIARGNKWDMYLQPLTTIHLNSNIRGEFETNGRKESVYILLIISIFILIIACINYINLSTAKAIKRAKEVGIRKVVGARKKQLIRQFLLESIFFSFISLILAMMLVELSRPLYNELINKSLIINYTDLGFFIGLASIILFTGLFGGIYPAMVLSAFRPIVVLKGGGQKVGKSPWLRNVLVIFQFVISVVLIVGTFIISNQLNLLQNKNLGFNKEKVIIIKNTSTIKNSIQVIKNDIANLAFVQEVAYSNRFPGISLSNRGCMAEGRDGRFTLNTFYSDEKLDDVLKLNLSKGRYFSKEYGTDSMAIIINEEAEKLIGFKDILGKRLKFGSGGFKHVIGVVKNIRYESKHQKVHPMAILNINSRSNPSGYFAVRVGHGNQTRMINELTRVWDQYSSGFPFDYAFLDEQYDSLYMNEMQTKKVVLAFSFLAVFIACLGLIGLASYIAQQKTKEIGIRKTFGASATTIALMLSRGFSKWVIIANLIAWPIAWYFFDHWLNNFTERCQLKWWYFALPTIMSFIIAWITVGYQTIKTSRANPVDALKYE